MKKILLIEDNENIRSNTAEILELANYKVLTAEDGKLGVEIALKEKPDLIICDIMMPVLDGFGVLHMLHKNPSTQNTPFIFLTAKSERTDFRKGMELGADDYITKPFSGTELLTAVESRLNKVDLLKKELKGEMNGLQQLIDAAGETDKLQELINDRNTNKYKKKQIIFSRGNRPTCLFYLKKGKVKLYKTNDDGKELVVDLYNEGDFLGYIALLENTNYKETAEAMEDAELTVIPKEEFEELINSNREVSRKFIQLLARNVSEKEEHLLKLAYNSLRKKVADALMAIYNKYNNAHNGTYSIDISRENLATIAGTATESLIRTLSDFKNEKLIEIKDGAITILNEKKLNSFLN
ncbi:response regulator [Flavihumibacter profundi]|uniref:response regulator n=1 Tax=Flavihumibacter profundi TaxID=2716883 RepID=UPI001CC72A77|nr:response regulator [Flavihumibacter profundi]MBZ5856563.1 response regulator [Flavihumibacter profundi]